MFLHHRPLKVLITGKSGSGKTTYFERLLKNGFKSYWQTVFLYDWQGEMAQRLQVEPIFSLEQIPQQLETGFVCYDPCNEFESDNETGLLCFAKIAFELCKANDETPSYPRLFAADEIQSLLGNDFIPPEIKSILQTGRRRGLDMACVSQQLNEMHNSFRSQITEVVTFQHNDHYVLQVMDKWGFDPEEVSQLEVGQYVYHNDKGIYIRGSLFGSGNKDAVEPEAQPDTPEAPPDPEEKPVDNPPEKADASP